MGEHARRAYASYPDIDYHIAAAVRTGQILIAHSPVDIILGFLPIGACAAALLRTLRDGTLSPALNNLRKAVAAISWRGRSNGKGMDILQAIRGIGATWSDAIATRQKDWGAEGDRIYRKLISVMVSAQILPGDDDWARRFIVIA